MLINLLKIFSFENQRDHRLYYIVLKYIKLLHLGNTVSDPHMKNISYLVLQYFCNLNRKNSKKPELGDIYLEST